MTYLGTLGGRWSEAVAINEQRQIVGGSRTAQGTARHAFLWQAGKMRDLGTLPGLENSWAIAINERGQVIGFSYKPRSSHVFLWQNGRITDLGESGLPDLRYPNEADVAINERGQIVGTKVIAGIAYGQRAFLWQDGEMRNLGSLGGKDSAASDINERGQIVGESTTKSGMTHAVLWQKGKMIDLGTLPGAKSSGAVAVNERNQIIGWSGPWRHHEEAHAVLWTLKRG